MELKDEIQRLKEGGAGGGGDKHAAATTGDDPFLKEELHEVKLGLKDANTEKNELRTQLQDIKVGLQGTKSELTLANS